jgi:hypothetical protein
MKTIVLCLFFFVSTSLTAQPLSVPCASYKSPLHYKEYGLSLPNGWVCAAREDKDDITNTANVWVTWKSGDKEISLVENSFIWDVDESVKNVVAPNAKEPLKSIRFYTELLLADKKILANKNEEIQSMVAEFLQLPSGVLFSKNNTVAIVYNNNGTTRWNGKEVSFQGSNIYKISNAGKFLSITYYGLTPDEVFSLVINPVIQQ